MTYPDKRAQIADRPLARARKEQELIGLKTETESRIRMSELRETQDRILAKIEQKLAEVRVPQPKTHAVFRGNCGPLEQIIAGMGEVVEEEVPAVTSNIPAVPQEQERLVVELNMPDVTQDVPPTGLKKVPDVRIKVPNVTPKVPIVPTNMPDVPQKRPVVDLNMPNVPQEVPTVDSNMPTVPQERPVVDSNMPDVSQDVPHTGLKKFPM